jgi:hypothetical protein
MSLSTAYYKTLSCDAMLNEDMRSTTMETEVLTAASVVTDVITAHGVEYQLPLADGTANQVLTSDGLANLSWTTVSGGGGGGGSVGSLQQVYDASATPKLISLASAAPVIIKALGVNDEALVVHSSTNAPNITLSGNGLLTTKLIETPDNSRLLLGTQATTDGVDISRVGSSTIIKGAAYISEKLTLNTNANTYSMPEVRGSSGTVLTSNGLGESSWSTVQTASLQQVYDASATPKLITLASNSPVIIKALGANDECLVVRSSTNAPNITLSGNGLLTCKLIETPDNSRLLLGTQATTGGVDISRLGDSTIIKGAAYISEKLTLNTNLNTYSFPENRGSNGTVLTSDGLGAVEWLPSNVQGSLVFVRSAADFPPVTIAPNIRALAEATTYYIIGNVDLAGTRLGSGFSCAIIGSSAETSILRSTGLGLVSPLISSTGSVALRNLRIDGVDTAFNFTGSSSTATLDWVGVTFSNIRSLGVISAVNNFIFSQGTILECSGLVFTGSINTIGFDRCLIQQTLTANQGSIISLDSACVVQRRCRVIYSAINVSQPGNTGINVDVSATVPVESYILDTCNFSNTAGAAAYGGVSFADNKARWIENAGVTNSNTLGAFTITGNAVAITPTTLGFGTVLAGTYVANALNQRFVLSTNRFVFGGIIARTFMVSVSITATNGSNSSLDYTVNIVKELSLGTPSLIAGFAGFSSSESAQPMSASAQGLVDMSSGNTVYISISSPDAAPGPITVTSMSVIVRPVN